MGIDMYIGEEEQVRMSNAYFYNEFANWVAEMGDFPQILDHTPNHGQYLHDPNEPASLYSGSIPRLKKELEDLQAMNPPEYAADIIESMLEAVAISERDNLKITMDDGAFFGD